MSSSASVSPTSLEVAISCQFATTASIALAFSRASMGCGGKDEIAAVAQPGGSYREITQRCADSESKQIA